MSIRVFRQTITVLTAADDTNGALGAIEVVSPSGAAPPLHVHRREDEAFYILDGDYTVHVGDDAIAGAPGTWVWGPRGVPHGYQVHSPVGRHLSLTMPGGFEGFFEEVADFATPSTDPRDAMGQMAASTAECQSLCRRSSKR